MSAVALVLAATIVLLMLACAVPRTLVPVRHKKIFGWVLVAVWALVAGLSLHFREMSLAAKAGCTVALFVGAEMMFTDVPERRDWGKSVMWAAVIGWALVTALSPVRAHGVLQPVTPTQTVPTPATGEPRIRI